MSDTFLVRFLVYAGCAVLFSLLALVTMRLFEKKLKSSACFLLVTLMLVRIFVPMGVFNVSLITLGERSPVIDTLPNGENSDEAPLPNTPPEEAPAPPNLPSSPTPPDVTPSVSFFENKTYNTVATIIVFGVSALSLSVYLLSDLLTRRRFKKSARRVIDPALLSLYTRLAEARSLDSLPALYTSPYVNSPCLVGLFHPRIYLGEESYYSESELTLLLSHELEHFRKGDLFKKFFALSIISFQWWNPFLRPLVKKLDSYLEAACDERVLENETSETVLSYSALMLRLCKEGAERRIHEKLTAYFSEKSGNGVKLRMKRLLDGKLRSRGLFLVISVLLISIATLFLIGFAPNQKVEASNDLPAVTTTAAPTNDLYPSTGDPDSITPAEKNGYTFSHWEKVTTADGEEMLKAIYTPNRYTVTFVTNGGTVDSESSLLFESTLPTASREGYTFGGWFRDADLTMPIYTVPASDTAIYAFWFEETNTSRFTFSIQGAEATLVSYTGGGTLVIPAYYCGYPVTTVGRYAFEGQSVTAITLPNTLKAVGTGAFYNCRLLETVVLYEGIAYLDRVAFDACYALKTVYFVGTAAAWQKVSGKDPSLPVTYLS